MPRGGVAALGPSCSQGPRPQASPLSPAALSPSSVPGATRRRWTGSGAAPTPGEELIPFLLQKKAVLLSEGGLLFPPGRMNEI